MLLLPLLVAHAPAKDLNGRLGIGFSQQLGGGATSPLTAVSVRFGLPTGKPVLNIGIEALAAVDITTTTTFFAGGRLVYGLVAEDNMNFTFAAGVGYASEGAEGFLRVQPALGAEFFLFGLENLGFTSEVGLTVDLGEATTVGIAPLLGMHYYF